MKRIRTHLTPVLIAAIVLAIAAGVVFAASVHFKNSTPLKATNNGSALTLTVTGALAGLGNADVLIKVTTAGTGPTTCSNPGNGNQAPGQNPANVTETGELLIPANLIKNGNVSFELTTQQPSQ